MTSWQPNSSGDNVGTLIAPTLSPHHFSEKCRSEGVPVSPSLLSTVAQEAFVLECCCPTYILNLLHRKVPTPVVTMRNPGFSDLPREKLYTVKALLSLDPHDGVNLHTINNPPTPPCILFCILPVSTLACSKILVLFIQAWWRSCIHRKPLDIGLV